MTQPVSRTSINEGLLGLQPMCKSVHNLNVCVDPRLELLAVIQWLSDYRNKYPLLTQHKFPYQQLVDSYFSSHRAHEAIRFMDELISRPPSYESPPFAFGAPPEVMLYLGPDGRLWDDVFVNTFLVGRAGGRKSLLRFTNLLRHFFHDTNFASMYEQSQSFYLQVVKNTMAKIGKRNYISEVEQFYGMQFGSYAVVLVPLYHSVGYGPRVTVAGTHHVYNIMGPHSIVEGVPDFGSETYFAGIQRHEFSHGFVNPLPEQY